MKKASIIIINYNEKTRINRAIDSAINQTFYNTEVIVVDDGSDKETRKIYEQYKGKIKLIQRERTDLKARTVPAALNDGIKASTGDYICVLGSDNYYSNTFVEECMKYDNDVIYTNWDVCGHRSEVIRIENLWKPNIDPLRNYLNFCSLDHQAIMLKRDLQMQVGLYDERFPRSQDADMLCRLMLKTQDWFHIPKVLFHFEKHEVDQQKNLASIYGKTMWTLKNNINFAWLLKLMQNGDPYSILSYIKGVNDFMTKPEWQKEFQKSEFAQVVGMFQENLKKELSE